jgi:hypothetical protein
MNGYLALGMLLMELVLLLEIQKRLGFWAALVISLFISLTIVFSYFYLRYFIPLRKKEPGFEYVYVEDDGTVREVSEDDQNYLNTHFHPGDGARPYIKTQYKSRNGWGNISGFISRRRVPRRLPIGPYIPSDKPQADAYYCQ